MTRTPSSEGRPVRRPETLSPIVLDETGWTREQILRIRAPVRPVLFAERRTAVGAT